MTLPEAIKELKIGVSVGVSMKQLKMVEAIQLGIEAGERIQKGRAAPDENYATLLPSETEE